MEENKDFPFFVIFSPMKRALEKFQLMAFLVFYSKQEIKKWKIDNRSELN